MVMSIILLINYSLYLSSRYVCVFPHLIFIILCCLYLKSAPPRLAILFAVCSYIILQSLRFYDGGGNNNGAKQ